jgi:hypothetical protein
MEYNKMKNLKALLSVFVEILMLIFFQVVIYVSVMMMVLMDIGQGIPVMLVYMDGDYHSVQYVTQVMYEK